MRNKNLASYKYRIPLYIVGLGLGSVPLFIYALNNSVYAVIIFALCWFITGMVDEALLYKNNREYYENTKNIKRFKIKIILCIIGEISLILLIVLLHQ